MTDIPKQQNAFLKEYAESITIALLILTIMFNLFLIVRIKYGSKIITKLTLYPYYFSLIALFAFMGCEIVEEFIDEDDLFDDNNPLENAAYRRTYISFYYVRQVAWLCFIGFRVF